MKTCVTFSSFIDDFRAMNRYDQFGYKALRVIFDYLEEYEESTGEEIELDVIAICCDYATQHWADIASDYQIEIDENENEDEQKQQVLDYLNDHTVVLGETDCEIVYQQF